MIDPPLPSAPRENPTKIARIMATVWPKSIYKVLLAKTRNLSRFCVTSCGHRKARVFHERKSFDSGTEILFEKVGNGHDCARSRSRRHSRGRAKRGTKRLAT